MIYRWKKEFWARTIQIIRDGNEVGHLVYDSGFTSRATGEIDGCVFRFRIKGLWKSRIIIADADEDIYKIELGTWRSTGRLAGGLRWSTNAWNSRWWWTNDAGNPLVSSATGNLWGTQGTITIADDATATDPRMLMLTGIYVNTYFIEATVFLIVLLIVLWP